MLFADNCFRPGLPYRLPFYYFSFGLRLQPQPVACGTLHSLSQVHRQDILSVLQWLQAGHFAGVHGADARALHYFSMCWPQGDFMLTIIKIVISIGARQLSQCSLRIVPSRNYHNPSLQRPLYRYYLPPYEDTTDEDWITDYHWLWSVHCQSFWHGGDMFSTSKD